MALGRPGNCRWRIFCNTLGISFLQGGPFLVAQGASLLAPLGTGHVRLGGGSWCLFALGKYTPYLDLGCFFLLSPLIFEQVDQDTRI